MTRLLHSMGSPHREHVASGEVAQTYIAALCEVKPELEVEILDVWATNLPE